MVSEKISVKMLSSSRYRIECGIVEFILAKDEAMDIILPTACIILLIDKRLYSYVQNYLRRRSYTNEIPV